VAHQRQKAERVGLSERQSGTNSAPFREWYWGKRDRGAIMLRIIYSLLLLVISICSTASVVWLLSFMGFELLLFAGVCFIAFTSSVTLAEEFVEWRRRRALHGQLLPPAS
jgi:hypothetical protein